MDLGVLTSGQLLIAALSTGSIYALVAVGLNLIYGTMRMLNIAHGDLAMIGAYVAYWLFTVYGLSPFISLPVSIVLSVVFAVVVYQLLVKTVLRMSRIVEQAEANSLLVFFGLAEILRNGSAAFNTTNPRGYQYLDQILTIGNASITANRLSALVGRHLRRRRAVSRRVDGRSQPLIARLRSGQIGVASPPSTMTCSTSPAPLRRWPAAA